MAFDPYQQVTDMIVAKLELASQWQKPWISAFSGMQSGRPINAITGKPYHGINVPLLWSAGYECPYWGTYKAWQQAGAQVRRGERSTAIVFWKRIEVRGNEDDDSSDDGESNTRLLARLYSVFNASQVDGWELKEKPAAPLPTTTGEQRQSVDDWIKSRGIDVRHVKGDRAYYTTAGDYVVLPEQQQFKSWEGYYCIAFHELGHATGHTKRLNRTFGARFGDQAYAFEELVAELTAAYLAADHGVTPQPREDHAAYIKNWLQVLKNDKRAVFTAASKAEAAAKWLHEQQQQSLAA